MTVRASVPAVLAVNPTALPVPSPRHPDQLALILHAFRQLSPANRGLVIALVELMARDVGPAGDAPDPECGPGLRVMSIKGDSMEPTFRPGDRVLVDPGDTHPSPGGVFVLWDGMGLIVKRVEPVPATDPAMVRLWPDNPRYDEYEIPPATVAIVGRVIGLWERM